MEQYFFRPWKKWENLELINPSLLDVYQENFFVEKK